MPVVARVMGLLSPAIALRRAIKLSEQKKFAEAVPLLALAARAGIPEAEYRIAECYLRGAGVPISQTEGALWLHRAASNGYVEAQCLLAALYVHGLARMTADASVGKARSDRLFATNGPAEPDF